MSTIRLKPGREKSLLRRHPWVFSGAIADMDGNPGVGDTVDVLDSRGGFLARGAYSPVSQIRVRVWAWDPEVVISPEFFRRRLQSAIASRQLSVVSV
ncbi:MAG: 23S rRNA (cytosine(1962)-C(5))-methyltransferase RlmI, partial [Chloroflexota bacterium]